MTAALVVLFASGYGPVQAKADQLKAKVDQDILAESEIERNADYQNYLKMKESRKLDADGYFLKLEDEESDGNVT